MLIAWRTIIHITWKWAMKNEGPLKDCQMMSTNDQWDDGDIIFSTLVNQM
jgi:hypothetical protein